MSSIFPFIGPVPTRAAPTAGRLHLTVIAGARPLVASAHAAVFWLVLRGQVEVRAKEGEFLLGPGDWIALHGDSAPHALGRAGTLLLGADLDPDLKQRGGGVLLFPARGRMPKGARGRALRSWQAGGAFGGDRREDSAGIGALLEFLLDLQADLIARIDRCPGHSERRRRQVMARMQRARLCLEGRMDGGLGIGELARRIHFSPWYFSKVFQALYGIGPLQFSVRMRLEHAHRLLATTGLPVTEVSAACGFDNPCSFARAFRTRFGMSASECRLRHAQSGDAALRERAWVASPARMRGGR